MLPCTTDFCLFLPHSKALQTSLLFSKDYGLISFLRKSLTSPGADEVNYLSLLLQTIGRAQQCNNKTAETFPAGTYTTFVFQLRDTRVEVLFFLEKFLDRVSPRVKGWEKTYAVDIRVSSSVRVFFFFLEKQIFRSFRGIHSKTCTVCESLTISNG